MTGASYRPISDQVVRHLAGRGKEEIDRMQDLIDRARLLLANGELATEDITSYWWESDRGSTPDKPPKIWVTYITHSATGEGLTHQIYVGLSSSEGEFRRQISQEFDRNIAHQVAVVQGIDALNEFAPEASFLVSAPVRQRLRQLDAGTDQPPAFNMLLRLHTSYV